MIWAVILGDVIGSSRASGDRDLLLAALHDSFQRVYTHIDRTEGTRIKFDIHRGDSFQGLIYRPENAFRAAIFIRACLRSIPKKRFDCRIAIGIGGIEYSGRRHIGMLDGDAFRAAAEEMDRLQSKTHSLSVRISSRAHGDLDAELKTECVLADAIIGDWKPTEAEAVRYALMCSTQQEIAETIGITQGAVSQRLANAKFSAVDCFLERYETIAREHWKDAKEAAGGIEP